MNNSNTLYSEILKKKIIDPYNFNTTRSDYCKQCMCMHTRKYWKIKTIQYWCIIYFLFSIIFFSTLMKFLVIFKLSTFCIKCNRATVNNRKLFMAHTCIIILATCEKSRKHLSFSVKCFLMIL
jgi:hypothetical protein